MLFPEAKVYAVPRVRLLPPKLHVLGQLTLWHVLNDVVAVQDLPIGLSAPIVVHTKRLCVPQRHRLLSKAEIGEVVCQRICGEELLSDLSAEFAVVLTLPFGIACLR